MASGMLISLCFVLLFVAASTEPVEEECKNEKILIGGPGGWVEGINKTWKQPEIFVGDFLVFPSGGEEAHTVFVFESAEEYTACNFTNAGFIGNAEVSWKVKHGGTYLFACNVPGHCEAGQKLNITVLPQTKECRRKWRDVTEALSPPSAPKPSSAAAKPPPPGAKAPPVAKAPSPAKAPLPSAAKRPPPPKKASAPLPSKGKAPAPQARAPSPAGIALPPYPAPPPGSECQPKVVIVGGEKKGWTFFIDKSWKPPVIYEGDFLKFIWTSDADHTVYQLTSADNYADCNFKGARLWGEKANVVIGPLVAPKTFYFACSFYGHCSAGQKAAITVVQRPTTCNVKAS